MTVINLTKENFEETIQNNDIVFVDFWAPWCGPCRAFAPTYEAEAAKHPGAVFAKVNTDEEQELAAAFQIRSIPTLMAFREQIGVFAQPGALPASALSDVVGQVESLDMEDVRKKVAEHQAKHAN
ncbi:MAG: thioredoxin [Deltaproteobacteria bacterium]|nr:thioredoxin [Deltaproteobacteria bacterium]